MALTYSELQSVSKKYFDDTITQQVYEDSAFFALLKSKHKITASGGESIQFPIRYKKLGQSAGTGFRTRVDFSSVETRTAGVLEWAAVQGYTLLHWDERVKNAGAGKIIDIAKDKAAELKEDFQDTLCSMVWGTDTTYIAPLAQIVDSSDTYAGIAVADASDWAATEDSSTTTLKLYGAGSLAYARNQATFGKHRPTHHFTTLDLASKFESLLEPKQIYEDKELANLGFRAVTYYGCPVIGDEYVSSGDWYGLDMSVFELVVHKDNDLNVTEWFDLKQAGYPNALAKYMSMVANLKCVLRKSNFKFTALDYTL